MAKPCAGEIGGNGRAWQGGIRQGGNGAHAGWQLRAGLGAAFRPRPLVMKLGLRHACSAPRYQTPFGHAMRREIAFPTAGVSAGRSGCAPTRRLIFPRKRGLDCW